MEISSTPPSQANNPAAQTATLAALKNAREAPGKAALQIIDGVAEQAEPPANKPEGVGRNLDAKA